MLVRVIREVVGWVLLVGGTIALHDVLATCGGAL